ncbi:MULTISPECIES: tyrosine-type recombinase/integrase [Blautia]|uniref:tyrosine-type recombinase/integrase n=2 Tax=Lachnospiraceae TaxID=186803 RepID=UPI003991A231
MERIGNDMLIKCPECDLQVSDRAFACPHCGYPLKEQPKPVRKSTRKRRRLPNGFGQISELKGRNLRKPFRAMVTVGKTPKGKPICKLLKPEAFFENYNDAYAALVEYNRNPYDLDDSITMSELYEKWKDYYIQSGNKEASLRSCAYAWPYCWSIKDMKVRDVRSRHILGCVENGSIISLGIEKKATPNTKRRIKSLLNAIFDYALQYDLVDRNYARDTKLMPTIQHDAKEAEQHHIAFTDEEMQKLWNNFETTDYADLVLIQCYSGWRPKELGLIEIKNVDLDNWTFSGGIKTIAGKNRLVPIHSRIRDLVRKRYDEAILGNSKYLFNYKNIKGNLVQLTYPRYQAAFTKIKDSLELNIEHKPHDGRVQFVTMAKAANVDEYAIKYMVGHNISDVTERVYTRREISWLAEEIEKIK